MATQLAEPFSPVIDGQLLTDQPGNLVSRGELRPHTPVFFSLQTDEGEMFINFLFPKRQNSRKVQVPPSRWREIINNVHPKSAEQVLEAYKPPCENDALASCDCHQLAKDWLTG